VRVRLDDSEIFFAVALAIQPLEPLFQPV
jgi:hypothetical protein